MATNTAAVVNQNKYAQKNHILKMITECEHHARCDRIGSHSTTSPKPTQRTLAIKGSILSLGPPVALAAATSAPPRTLRRSLAGKAVRNIANIPFFTTADSNLTSFLRFPPEVRIQIYNYLLISHQKIQYGICPVKLCLAGRERTWQLWIRHGIFPAILECCRKINAEGSAILYGKNMFEMECYSYWPVIETWSPGRANLKSITRLSLLSCSWQECLQDRKTLELMDLFPALREVNIRLEDVLVEEWVAFLEKACERLRRMNKFTLDIQISDKAGTVICEQWRGSETTVEEMCLRTYTGPFLKQQDVWRNREVRWAFDEESDSYARCHCVLGTLSVFVG